MSVNVFLFLIYLLQILKFSKGDGGHRWDYQGTLGPSHWHVDYEDCGGSNQSPIDIDIDHVELDTSLQRFDFSAYQSSEGVTQELENVGGHTVEVKYRGAPLIVRRGDLLGEYVVDQFHFHWGSEDSKGSEHTINGHPFPMEMHIVHHSNNFTNLSEALDQENGLVVNAFFIENGTHNPAFEELLSHFDRIVHAGDKVDLELPIILSELLPKDMDVYYRYHGSLTTPPCYETVTWTLFKSHIIISEEQLNMYRALKRNPVGEPEAPLVDDFRPIQPLNHRHVYTNHKLGLVISANSSNNGLILLIILGLLSYFLYIFYSPAYKVDLLKLRCVGNPPIRGIA